MTNLRESMIKYRKNRLQKLAERTDFKYVDLDNEQEEKLLDIILNMSIDRQNLLIFKNYYNHSFNEIEDIFGIENAKGEYINLVGVLSSILDLGDAIISDNTMKKISTTSAKKINSKTNKEFEKDLGLKHSTNKILKFSLFLSNKVAIVVIAFLIGYSVLVGANVYAEGKIFEWVVNTFEKYTSFNITEENKISKDNINIEIGYIPERFEFRNKTVSDSADIYYYKSEKDHLIIKFIYNTIDSGLNTEDTKQYEFEFDSVKVITWEKANQNYFIVNKKGISCQIYGNITKDEFIKIYNKISINDN